MKWELQSEDSTSDNKSFCSSTGVVNLTIIDSATQSSGNYDVQFLLPRETVGAVLESLYVVRDQLASISG
eukprot:c26312_g1_i2 orf=690-899(-)